MNSGLRFACSSSLFLYLLRIRKMMRTVRAMPPRRPRKRPRTIARAGKGEDEVLLEVFAMGVLAAVGITTAAIEEDCAVEVDEGAEEDEDDDPDAWLFMTHTPP